MIVGEALRVGLIGAGVFGGYHAAKIAAAEAVDFSGIFDADQERSAALAAAHHTATHTTVTDLMSYSDAVIIATPAHTHGDLVETALAAGCHVLVEKPLALTAVGATRLAELAEQQGRVLQVGHQERLVCEALGLFNIDMPPLYFESVRVGPPPAGNRNMDVSVVWDLMIHDLDLAHRLFGPNGQIASCEGTARLGSQMDRAVAELQFGAGQSARLEASRISDDRQRTLRLDFTDGAVEVDFLARTVRNTTGHALNAQFAEAMPDPLGAADAAFFNACRGAGDCPVPGWEAARAVATAEQIERMALAEMGA